MNAGPSDVLSDLSLLKTALAHAANAIAVCEAVRDDQGTIVDFRYRLINRHWEKFVGQRSQITCGRSVTLSFPGAYAGGIEQRAAEVMLTGQEHRQQIQYTTPDGYTGWADFTISPWKQHGVVISLLEVSDPKLLLPANRQLAELLQNVFRNSLNGIWAVEAVRQATGSVSDFRFILVNQPGSLKACMSGSQFPPPTLLTLYPAVGRIPFPGTTAAGTQTIFERYVEVVDTGLPVTYLIDYQHDGLSGWYQISVSKLNDGLLITFLDVSDLKRAQQQLERSNHELQQTNHNLEQFTYVASHDLQEPLRKIQSFGDLLTNHLGQNADGEVVDMVRRMQAAAQRMQVLVKDLLAYSRLTTRQDEFSLVPLSQVITESLTDLQPLVDSKQAIIETDPLPTVPGDAVQLRQLFFCLINNALKFHKPGTTPRIEVSWVAADTETADLPTSLAESGRRYVAVSVKDDGIGFDQKYTDRIFTIFQRLHGRGHYDGTGIGLALAQKVAQNHGGAVTARSLPGQGAMFTAWLPVN
jgi:signal transduction histidine kinase